MSKQQDYNNFLMRQYDFGIGVITGTIGGLIASWVLIATQSFLKEQTPSGIMILSVLLVIPIFIIVALEYKIRVWIYKKRHKIK